MHLVTYCITTYYDITMVISCFGNNLLYNHGLFLYHHIIWLLVIYIGITTLFVKCHNHITVVIYNFGVVIHKMCLNLACHRGEDYITMVI